jgi:Carboxypeptidase regulatory-like domain
MDRIAKRDPGEESARDRDCAPWANAAAAACCCVRGGTWCALVSVLTLVVAPLSFAPAAHGGSVLVTGKVTDEAGKPIGGAVVRLRFGDDVRKSVTDAAGAYRVIGCEPGEARVVAYAKGRAMEMQDVRIADNMRPVDFQLKPGETVRIRVLDEHGLPIPRARIVIQEWRGPLQDFEFDHMNSLTDARGIWQWDEAPHDEFHADVCRPGGMRLGGRRLIARSEEYVFRVPPCLLISGKAINAETKQPVKKFRVIPQVRGRAGNGNRDSGGSITAADGHFQLRETEGGLAYGVRIEADGYAPAESRDIPGDEGNVSLELSLTQHPTVTVLTPAGRPAAKATVALAFAGTQVMINNGQLTGNAGVLKRAVTDDSGRCGFAPQNSDFWFVVVHPAGHAQVKCSRSSVPKSIQLTPWARVEGSYRVARKPKANVTFWVSHANAVAQNAPWVFENSTAKTDSNGRFVIDHAFPGRAWVSRSINLSGNGGTVEMESAPRIQTNLTAGKTTHVDFGATGRPVTGQLRHSSDAQPETPWNFAYINVMPLVPLFQAPTFMATIDRDGNFSVDDVPPGEYSIHVFFYRNSNESLNNHRFTVPEINEKLSQRPVDLGVLTLTPNRNVFPRAAARAVRAPAKKAE